MRERRRRHRIRAGQLIEACLFVDGLMTRGRVVDLNNAGAFVATDLVLAKNASVVVELRVPGENQTLPPLKAIVARRTEVVKGRKRDFPAGLGLVFTPENVIERAVTLSQSDRVELENLPPAVLNPVEPGHSPVIPAGGVHLEALVNEYESRLLREALRMTGGVKKHAAQLLGISFRSFRYRLEKLGVEQTRPGAS